MAEEKAGAGEEHGAAVATTDDATGQAATPANGGATLTITEQELKARIESAVRERTERSERVKEAAAKKAREEAEAEALKKAQDYEALDRKRQERITELETQAATLESTTAERDRYRAALDAFLKPQLERVPDHIRVLLADRDPVAQLEYIAANGDKLTGASATIPATPKAGASGLTDSEKRAKAAKVRF